MTSSFCTSNFVRDVCNLLAVGTQPARANAFAAYNTARNALFVKCNGAWIGKDEYFSFPKPVIPGDVWDATTADTLTPQMVRQLCVNRRPVASTRAWTAGEKAGFHVTMGQTKLQNRLNEANRAAGFDALKGTGSYFPSPYAQNWNAQTQKWELVSPAVFAAQHPGLRRNRDWAVRRIRGRDVVVILRQSDRQCPPFQAGVCVDVPVMKMVDGQLILSHDSLETVSSARVKKTMVRREDGTTYATCKPDGNTWMSEAGANAAATALGYAPLSRQNFDRLPEEEQAVTVSKYGQQHVVPYKVVSSEGRTVVAVLETDARRGVLPAVRTL